MVLVLQSRVLDLELKWVRWICCMWYYGVWLRHGYSMSCPYLCFRFVRLRSRSSSGEALSKLLSSLEGRLSFTAVCDGAIAAKICLIYLHAWFSGSVQRIWASAHPHQVVGSVSFNRSSLRLPGVCQVFLLCLLKWYEGLWFGAFNKEYGLDSLISSMFDGLFLL